MKRLDHPNIVRLKEVIDDPKSKKVFMGGFEPTIFYCGAPSLPWSTSRLIADTHIFVGPSCIVLEFMAGGQVVWQDENRRPTMTVDEARRTFRDVLLGLEYCKQTCGPAWCILYPC
jgi:[calcium/calmodulin-dependent protein kinase] kinase